MSDKIKAKELRLKSTKKLIELKKELKIKLMESQSFFGKVNKGERRGSASRGENTSMQKNIRKNIARINMILGEKNAR